MQRLELREVFPLYELISDALEGERRIKSQRTKYLPRPSCPDDPVVAENRYNTYLLRALYYNVTRPTLDALVGQLFLRKTVVELPEMLKPLIENLNGEGLSLEQLLKQAANCVLAYGRGGFLADFPKTNGETTVGEIKSGEVRPVIRFYEPWTIRNWRVEKRGKLLKVVMLVLDETYEYASNESIFNVEKRLRNRVFTLSESGQCNVTVYDEGKIMYEYEMLNKDGLPMDSIPFEFIGSENNDPGIDEPPFYNLANLNIAHYRNSADYEESVYLTGQPTPVYTGLTEDWVELYFKDGVPFGSRASVPLPAGATAELLQAMPNTLAFEAMTHKEEQMISIGAKIAKPKSTVERKEAEIKIEAAAQRSVLTTTKDNLQMAMIASLKRAADFIGADNESIKVELNENFDLQSMSAEELRFLIELYTTNGIAFTEFREVLRRSGIAKLDDKEAITQITADKTMKESLQITPPVDPNKTQPVDTKKKTNGSKA